MHTTSACLTLSVDQFREQIAELDIQRKLTPPRYARRKLLAAAGSSCPLCQAPFDRSRPRAAAFPIIATVLHTFLGGPLIAENLFVCCRSCQMKRGSADLLTVPGLSDDLAAQRTDVLQLSLNHLVPLPKSATLQAARDELAKRHAAPRSRVYAAQTDDGTCLLGITRRYGDKQSKGLAHLLSKLAGATVWADAKLTVYRLPDDEFRSVVWELINANAWVVGLGRRTVGRDYIDHWWVASYSVGELRNHKVGGLRVPLADAKRVVGERAMRYRKQRSRERVMVELKLAQAALDDAEAQLDAYFEACRSPTGFPTDISEGQRLAQVRLAASQRWLAARQAAA